MNIRNRLFMFISIFSLMNLAFIPLISLYGLRVCPILTIPGFGFGCYYSAIYVTLVNIFNGGALTILLKRNVRSNFANWVRANRLLAYIGIYFVATMIALVSLMVFLSARGLPISSRGPEILLLASLMLGLTQAYGLDWALGEAAPPEEMKSLRRFRYAHITRTLFPMAAALLVTIHFMLRQSGDLNNGHVAPLSSHDTLISQSILVVLLLLAWLTLTFSFHFLSESKLVTGLERHLAKLSSVDTTYRSSSNGAWGLWAIFISHLNSLSGALSERSSLLNSFSRFVTSEVAHRALAGEIRETGGRERVLTVFMSDIRNFTAASEKMKPDDVVFLLNEYFTAMLSVAATYRLSIDKFIGDGILAYIEPAGDLGDPNLENQACVEAALAMLKKLAEVNVKLASRSIAPIKIGIGIYRGPLVIGLIGSAEKLQHTIIGDTVNRAARLESLSKDLGVDIVMSADVWNSLDKVYRPQFKEFGRQAAKGLSDGVDVFGGPIS